MLEGTFVVRILTQLHAITGSDTTAYKFNIRKVRESKKVIKDPSSTLLICKLGKTVLLSDDDIAKVMQFIQTVMYGGKIHGSYVSTRVRLYKNLKTKSSVSLPADPDSI